MNFATRIGLAGVAVLALAGAAAADQPVETITALSFNQNPIAAGTPAVITATVTQKQSGAPVSDGKVILRYFTLNGAYTSCATIGATATNFPSAWYSPNASSAGGADVSATTGTVVGMFDTTGLAGTVVGFEAQYVGGGHGGVHFGGSRSGCSDLQIVSSWRHVQEGDGATKGQGYYGNRNGFAFLQGLAQLPTVGFGYTMSFTSVLALSDYMNGHSGTPSQLTGDYTNPPQGIAGEFGRQVAALKLNMLWDAIHSNGQLGAMRIVDPTSSFNGMSVGAFLEEAEQVLGGMAPLPDASIAGDNNSSYTHVADMINHSFEFDIDSNGLFEPSSWALQFLFIAQ